MSGVQLSSAVRSNLAALHQTAGLVATTQQRLATGKRVNSAFDNPENFFAAASFNSRAANLNMVVDGISRASKVLESANSSITSITNLVTSARTTADSSLQNARTTAQRLGSVTGLTSASSFAVVSARTITVGDGATTATITSTGNITVQQIIDGVNNAVGLRAKASLASDGRLRIEATSTNTLVVGGTAVAAELTQYGLSAGTTAAGTLNSSRSTLAAQFDSILTQIDQLARDADFDGINLLNGGSLDVKFNNEATSSLTVSGATINAAGLGLTASTNTFQTDKDINDALGKVTTALSALRTQSAIFTSQSSILTTRQDFTKSMIGTLKSAADNLVLADMNEEAANLTALQARQELSLTALSLAAQADQSVLRLFR